jgi:hypothetical protein
MMVMGLLDAPPLRFPVLKTPPVFEVAVCVMPSMLCHATVWLTVMVSGLGEYELTPAIPTMLMVTSAVPPGAAGLDFFLHESVRRPTPRTNAKTNAAPHIDLIDEPPWSEYRPALDTITL